MVMYEDVTLKRADNGGYLVCYSEKKKGKRGTYGEYHYSYKKEAFSEEEEDLAMDRWRELSEPDGIEEKRQEVEEDMIEENNY